MAILSEVNGYGLASAKPAGATEGYLYYETDTLLFKRYNGSSWDTMSTVVTPTGAPLTPWYTRPGQLYMTVDAQQQGTAWFNQGGRATPTSSSGTIDGEVGAYGTRVLAAGSVMYDTTPVAGAMVGAIANKGTVFPFNDVANTVEVDYYFAGKIATHGLTDLDFVFGEHEVQPTKVGVAGEWSTWSTTAGAHMGFHGVYGTTNWQIFGTHNNGSAYVKTVKDSGVPLTAQTEYLLEYAYESATNTVSFYINGSLVGTLDMDTEAGPFNSGHNDSAQGLVGYMGVQSHSTTPGSPQSMEAAWWRVYVRQSADDSYLGTW